MRWPRSLILVLAGAASLFAPVLSAQRYNFKFYGEDEGLKNLAVQTMLQDRAGFLWVGTQNGLFRYDGDRFEQFAISPGAPNRVDSLSEDSAGTLLVGTTGGLFRRVGDSFSSIRFDGTPKSTNRRQGIAADLKDRI